MKTKITARFVLKAAIFAVLVLLSVLLGLNLCAPTEANESDASTMLNLVPEATVLPTPAAQTAPAIEKTPEPDVISVAKDMPLIETPAPKTVTIAGEQEKMPDYSFYYFTDTQHYSKKYPQTFYTMTEWMCDHIEEYNVQYAFFTGDFIHNRDDKDQWVVAKNAMAQLEEKLPVFAIAGNHDVGGEGPDYTTYSKHFGPEHYKNNGHIVDWFENGKGRADTFTIGDTKYLFAGIGWGAGDEGIKWLSKILDEYKDHKAILFFHDYIKTEGVFSDTGSKHYKNLVKKHENVFMVLCGHRYNCMMFTTEHDDDGDNLTDRKVYHIMMNYQAFENGGDGYLAVIRVYEDDHMIMFDTYSPTLDKWYHFEDQSLLNKEKLRMPVKIFS
ncbi:metallophosphoesterase [Christensenellaceae bacterium OttesenSCG-928-M15]|nr:metallophosphoesterase [Christensenellaceae bacterium OttesenSCG-928-M15]